MADIFRNILESAAYTAMGKDRAEELRKRESFQRQRSQQEWELDLRRRETESRIAANRARGAYYQSRTNPIEQRIQNMTDEEVVDLVTKARKMIEPRQNWQTGREDPPDPRLVEVYEQIIKTIQQVRKKKGQVELGFKERVASGLEKELTSGFNRPQTGSAFSNMFQSAPMQMGNFQQAPSIATGTAKPIPRPKTREEVETLLPGTVFIDPMGVKRVR